MSSSLAFPPLHVSIRAAKRQWQNGGATSFHLVANSRLQHDSPRPTATKTSAPDSTRHTRRRDGQHLRDTSGTPFVAPTTGTNFGHAPHGKRACSTAGPSRCFCSFRALNKGACSSAAAPVLLEHSLEAPSYEPRASHFVETLPSQPTLNQSDSIGAEPITTQLDDPHFFTSALSVSADAKGKQRETVASSSWIDGLAPDVRHAFVDQARVLVHSGERSVRAIAAAFPGDVDCTEAQREELRCLVLLDCIDRHISADVVRDLYHSSVNEVRYDRAAHQSVERVRRPALDKCFRYFVSAGLLRDAAILTQDPRLQRARARHMIHKLLFFLEPPETRGANAKGRPLRDSLARRSARLALQETSTSMCAWTEKGVVFKAAALHRTFVLLSQARAYGHLLRLARALQGRTGSSRDALHKSRNSHPDSTDASTAQGTSLPTSTIEFAIWLLHSQRGDGPWTALELFTMLRPEQRTVRMYHLLFERFGEAPLHVTESSASATETSSTGVTAAPANSDAPDIALRRKAASNELWREFCASSSHNRQITAHTISGRILSHAANGDAALVRQDLLYLQTTASATFLQLSERSRLAAIRCMVGQGDVTAAFRLAWLLLSHLDTGKQRQRTRVFDALIAGAVDMRGTPVRRSSLIAVAGGKDACAVTTSTSKQELQDEAEQPEGSRLEPVKKAAGGRLTRSQRLRRFFERLRSLQARYPFTADMYTVELLVRLLARWQHVVRAPKLYAVLDTVEALLPPPSSASSPCSAVPSQRAIKAAEAEERRKAGLERILATLVAAFEERSESDGARRARRSLEALLLDKSKN